MKEITIQKKYLIFPVNTYRKCKKVTFSRDGKAVYRLNMKLDSIAPDFFAYVDMSRFMGERLTLTVDPWVEVSIRESDTMDLPELYNEPMRPTVHFTTKNGWINDPNGLIYLDGASSLVSFEIVFVNSVRLSALRKKRLLSLIASFRSLVFCSICSVSAW